MKHNLANKPRFVGTKDDAYLMYHARSLKWFEGFEKEKREVIKRKMQARAGSIFDRRFEAGMVYQCLLDLGYNPDWKTRKEVEKFIKKVVYSAFTDEDAEKKLEEILGET